MDIIYRKFVPSDKPELVGMVMGLYQEDPDATPMTLGKIEATLRTFSDHPEMGAVEILATGDAIVGYCILANYWSNEFGGNLLHIDEIYIKPAHRSQGIAGDYIDHLIQTRARDSVAIQLEVLPANHRARAFYERKGFKVSRRTWYHYAL